MCSLTLLILLQAETLCLTAFVKRNGPMTNRRWLRGPGFGIWLLYRLALAYLLTNAGSEAVG